MKRHIVLVAALVGLTGLTACASTSEDLSTPSSSVSSIGVTDSASSAGGASPATSVTSATSTAPTTNAVPTSASTIPEEYRGHWNWHLADCSDEASEGTLFVEADTMTFHETFGRVLAVTAQGDQISVAMKLSSEGDNWEETRTWSLSPDGATLTDVTTGAIRFRCT